MDLWTMAGGLALAFGVFYLLVLRPKQQEDADRDKMLAAVAKDDRIVTSGGLHGRVVESDGDVIVLEIAEKTRVRIDRSAVARKLGVPTPDAAPAKS